MTLLKTTLGLALAAGALAGCTVPQSCPAVPPLQAEIMPLPPVSEQQLVWQPGAWEWNGSTYLWRAGQFVPKQGSTTWVPGSWAWDTAQRCVWVPAHWM